MFDLAWSEIALIGVVALIAIGPKDMPVAIKAVAEAIKKARRMAGEFQTHVDEMVREANLHEVRDHINDIRNLDIKGKILGAVDGDGSLRRTMTDSPFNAAPPPVTPVVGEGTAASTDVMVDLHAQHTIEAPAFIPPGDQTPQGEHVSQGEQLAAGVPAAVEVPAMIPPAYTDPRAAPPLPAHAPHA